MGKSRTSGISKTTSGIGIGGGGAMIMGGGSLASFSQANANAQPVTELSVDGATPQQVATTLQANKINNANFSDTDNADYHQLYNGKQYYQNQALSIDQRIATMNYLSDQPEPNSMYSASQNLNYNLNNGIPLNANQQFMYNNLQSSMHNLGYNLNLQRYDHADSINGLLQSVGVNNSYDSMTESQLKNALVGVSYKSNAFTSTSYNDFTKAGSSANTFTSRAVKIQYSAKAKAQAMMPGNGAGGNLGEIILGNTNNFKITDVKFDGRKARYKGTQSYGAKGVTLYVDVE
jgi:hypothetical protein